MNPFKLILSLLFMQCFVYKGTNFGLTLEIGLTITPDRLVSVVIVILTIWKIINGDIQLKYVGKSEFYMLLFAIICTMSAFVIGTGSHHLYYLFDFNYNPFVIFILAKSLPHSHKKLEFLSFAVLAVGAYLAINGVFEYRGPHRLVWPKYIL